jgi:hypothetical protein
MPVRSSPRLGRGWQPDETERRVAACFAGSPDGTRNRHQRAWIWPDSSAAHPLDTRPAQVAGRAGRAVFVSSHLMSEMALTADHLIVIGRGPLVADAPIAGFVQQTPAARSSCGHRVESRRIRLPYGAQLIP